MDEVQVDDPDAGRVTTTQTVQGVPETAERQRSAVSLYVAVVAVLAATSLAWVTYRQGSSFSLALLVFAVLAAVADVREVRLPGVGVVGMSFVPVLAALVVLGLWPAMIVAIVSGATSAGFTRDPQKIVFNIANYVLSTFVAGIVFLGLAHGAAGFVDKIVPAFFATAVDFFANTIALAGVVSLSTGDGALAVWRRNYQWALPGYLAGATFALFAAWLYSVLGVAGLVLALPPVVLIYYSYEIYVSRARDRVSFDATIASFRDELTESTRLHDELRTAQLKVAAEIERARRIQTDLLPKATPPVEGLELAQRIEFLGDMGGDYYDYIPFGDGRLGIVCGDVMGKGLAAALIMAMARSLLHDSVAVGKQPGEILAKVNDGLARDLEGQRLPYFLTLALAVYDPAARSLAVAGGGHNPLFIFGPRGVRQVPSRGPAMGVRPGLQFPEDRITLQSDEALALYTDGLTEARSPEGELFGLERLMESLVHCHDMPLGETLDAVWNEVISFRAESSPSDDATLLLAKLV
jgi:serine phosphatase RsbU (regulator of sigma subunit)